MVSKDDDVVGVYEGGGGMDNGYSDDVQGMECHFLDVARSIAGVY